MLSIIARRLYNDTDSDARLLEDRKKRKIVSKKGMVSIKLGASLSCTDYKDR